MIVTDTPGKHGKRITDFDMNCDMYVIAIVIFIVESYATMLVNL